MENPFAYRVNDAKMNQETAPNYIPPEKRKLIKDYMT